MDILDKIKMKALKTGQLQDSRRFAKIEEKAYEDAYYQLCKTFMYRQMVSDLIEHGKPPMEMKNPKYVGMLQAQADRLVSKPPFLLITVNVRPNTLLDDLKKKVEKFVKKKTIQSFAYVYEVRKDDFTGLHAHILVQYDDKPYNFKRGAKNTFKTICDVNNPNILNFRFVQLDKLLSKYNYLKGEKQSKKLPGVKHSEQYRTKNNLLPIYESIPPLPCRDTEKIPLIEEAE